MNSFEIRDKLSFLKNIHTYVCAKDQLINIKSCDFAVVCNNESSYLSGQHWLAFYKSKGQKYIDFFDSFGLPIEFYGLEFISFINSHGGFVRYNNEQLQSNLSNYCGMYCLYFLFHRHAGVTFVNILNNFNLNKKSNDMIVKKFWDEMLCSNLHSENKCLCENECKYHKPLSTINWMNCLYLYIDL